MTNSRGGGAEQGQYSNGYEKAALSEAEFKSEVEHIRSSLKGFTLNLTKNPTEAEDLSQETLLKAWQHRSSFQKGTNFGGWIFMIARNTFLSQRRKIKGWMQVEETIGLAAKSNGYRMQEQEAHLALKEVEKALESLTPEHRQAIMLVAVDGMTYEEAAEIASTAVGTIKSRVNRAREALRKALNPEEE